MAVKHGVTPKCVAKGRGPEWAACREQDQGRCLMDWVPTRYGGVSSAVEATRWLVP